jgi:hypothetical protein
MAVENFEQILCSINNSEIRIALERLFALAGIGPGSDGTSISQDIIGDVTGVITGSAGSTLIGDITGDVTGSIDGAVVDGDTLITKTLTPVNAVAAVDTLTFTSSMKHGESFVIGDETFDINGDAVTAYAGVNTEVDITAAATAAQATEELTLNDVAIDGETVTIGSDVYEFDTDGSIAGGSTVAVDVSGGSTVIADGTLTLAATDIHDDTIVVEGTTSTLKADGTAGSATVIDIEDAATSARATAVLTMSVIPGDGEIFSIGTRTYEFDPTGDGIGGSDVEIDTNGLTTVAQVVDRIELNYNADGSKTAVAVSDNVSTVTFTYEIAGVAGNAIASTNTMGDSSFGGDTFAGGAAATAQELVDLVYAHYENGGAGAEADLLADASDATTVTFHAVLGGTAGNSLTTTDTGLTTGFSAVTLENGVDPTKGECQTALAAQVAITGLVATQPYSFADVWGSDADTLTMHNVGVEGNGVTHEYSGTNTGWTGGDSTTDGGVDGTPTEHEVIFAALTPAADVTMAAAGGTAVTCTSDVAGVIGNAIVATEALTGCAWGDGSTLVGGIDGTVGSKGQIEWDASYMYVCILANTVADANWERAGISSY